MNTSILKEQTNQKELYESEGYYVYNQFFSREYIDKINAIIDSLELKVGESVFDEDGTGKVKQIQYLWNYHEEFVNILNKVRLVAEELTGVKEDDLCILNMQCFEKHPEISKPTRSHQDNAYFKVTPTTALTFWLSLDDIDEENGCLYYAPKTHITPTRKHQRYHKDTTFRFRSGVPGLSLCLHEHPEETDIPMITKKGDLLVHNCNLIHRAGKNNSKDRRRRAIGIALIPKNCKIDPLLEKYHNERLKEDIELQKIKDPKNYRELKDKFSNLFL